MLVSKLARAIVCAAGPETARGPNSWATLSHTWHLHGLFTHFYRKSRLYVQPNTTHAFTSLTERNSSKGKTRCLSKKWAILVVRSYSAIFTAREEEVDSRTCYVNDQSASLSASVPARIGHIDNNSTILMSITTIMTMSNYTVHYLTWRFQQSELEAYW